MDKQKNIPQKDTDVTRSEQRQTVSGADRDGQERRAEGSVNKGNPKHTHGSHKEGQTPYQSDDPSMDPSDIDEDK